MHHLENDPRLAELQARCVQLEGRVAELTAVAERFIDNVSHEFRTPLTVIREYASILRDGLAGSVAEAQRRYLDQIIDRDDDLTLLVDDLLDLGKFESGLFSARRKPCRAADLVKCLKPGLQRKAMLKGIALEIDLGDGLPALYCDAELVRRLLANLAANAFKFSEPGGCVQIWSRVANAHEVVMGVSDDGPGIDADQASRIFERFTQLDTPNRSSTKGFGLGLAVARQLATINLGEIMLASNPGEGSTFSFTVPRATPQAAAMGYLAMLSKSAAAEPVSLIQAQIDDTSEPRRAVAVDEFLHHIVRWNDLVWQSTPRGWQLLIAGGHSHAVETVGQIKAEWNEFRRSPATSAAPDIELNIVGEWPQAAALPALLACLGENAQSGALPGDPQAGLPATRVLSTDLRQQQRCMNSDVSSILAGVPVA
ncbi:MAG: sensor histidine kinase [Pirellulales bacterium]